MIENETSKAGEWLLLCFVLLAGLLLGWIAGLTGERARMKNEAVKAGHAEYSSVSGEWKWKDSNNGSREP